MSILVFEDKLGITQGYRWHWESLVLKAGLYPSQMAHVSLWRSGLERRIKLVIQKGNRKSPGFNPEVREHTLKWFLDMVNKHQPEAVLIQDLALLHVVEPNWDNAILDNLRGGVYAIGQIKKLPVIVSLPISAINSKKTPKDIAALNGGARSKDDWEERKNFFESKTIEGDGDEEPTEEDREETLNQYVGSDEIFFEPYVIPYGRFVILQDLFKLNRIINAVRIGQWP